MITELTTLTYSLVWGGTVNISSKNSPAGDKVQLQHLLPHSLCLQTQVWNIGHKQELVYCSGTSSIATAHLGLVHFRVRWATPPPQVREQGENSDQLDQEPCTTTEELSSSIKTQWPFKHHWKRPLLIRKQGRPKRRGCIMIAQTFTPWGAHSVPSSSGTKRRLHELSSWGLTWQDRVRQVGWW